MYSINEIVCLLDGDDAEVIRKLSKLSLEQVIDLIKSTITAHFNDYFMKYEDYKKYRNYYKISILYAMSHNLVPWVTAYLKIDIRMPKGLKQKSALHIEDCYYDIEGHNLFTIRENNKEYAVLTNYVGFQFIISESDRTHFIGKYDYSIRDLSSMPYSESGEIALYKGSYILFPNDKNIILLNGNIKPNLKGQLMALNKYTNALNIRKGPMIYSKIIDTVRNNKKKTALFEVQKHIVVYDAYDGPKEQNWGYCKINYGKKIIVGWCCLDYLHLIEGGI